MLNGTSLFLIGMMGAGKSTVGRLLAQKLQYQFVDTDELIERCTGKTIPEIFANAGEAAFREVEHQVLAEISAYTRLAIATGGGIVMNPMNWAHLHNGVVVWLDVPIPELYRRLQHSSHPRPLLQTADPLATLTKIYEQRRDRYAQADIQFTVTEQEPVELVCDRLLSVIQSRIELDRLKKNDS